MKCEMRSGSGIVLVALLVIVISIGIIGVLRFNYAREYLYKQRCEDIKATMLAIQGTITNVQNKHIVDTENNALVGTKLDIENNESEFKISDGLKESLTTVEEPEFYILSKEDLLNNGIKDVEINEDEFYVVDYNTEEVFYSLGIEGKYKLSEM